MAATYRNYGDFTTPTPVAIGSRAFPSWGNTFAGDLGSLVTRKEFRQTVLEQSFDAYAWVQSGIVQRNPNIDFTTGSQIELPMIRPFKANKEYVESNTTWGASGKGHLTVQKLNADSAFVPIQQCAFAVGTDDLARWMSGVDPLAIASGYLAENIQRFSTETLKSLLTGLFSATGPLESKVVDISRTGAGTSDEDNFLTGSALVRGKSKNGQRGEQLTIAAMHSNVAYYLQQIGMLTFSTSALSTGGSIKWGGGGVGLGSIQVAQMAGFTVVVDDTLTPTIDATNGDKYPVYLFEPGIVSSGIRNALRVRYDTNILSFQEVMAVDWSAAMGVLGMSWIGDPDIVFPTDADMADPDNWESKVSDLRTVGIVKMIVNTPFATNP